MQNIHINIGFKTMNIILKYMIEQRNGHYTHALEVNDVYELESTIENFIGELQDTFTVNDFKDFFSTISLCCLNDEYEDDVYNFDIDSYIDELMQ